MLQTALPRAGEPLPPSALFREVEDLLARDDACPDRLLHLTVETPAGEDPAGDPAGLALRGAALHRALVSLHRRGGLFTCLSGGTLSGAALEIALIADRHYMRAGSRMRLPGVADEWTPCAGGWSRIFARLGPSRAAGLLLDPERGTLDADAARDAGLCDGVLAPGAPPPDRAADAPPSRRATRLVLELADRHSGRGGLTPRQARLLERACFALAFATTDPRTGIEAFFSDTAPRFDGAD